MRLRDMKYISVLNIKGKINNIAIKNHIALSCHVISFIDFARECNMLFNCTEIVFLLINMLENGISRVLLLANKKTVK